jgi:hypothetical protein
MATDLAEKNELLRKPLYRQFESWPGNVLRVDLQ